MKIDWKQLKRDVEAESRLVRKRRADRYDEIAETLKEAGHERTMPGRAFLRMNMSGQPRSRIFAEKMKVPKGKQ